MEDVIESAVEYIQTLLVHLGAVTPGSSFSNACPLLTANRPARLSPAGAQVETGGFSDDHEAGLALTIESTAKIGFLYTWPGAPEREPRFFYAETPFCSRVID